MKKLIIGLVFVSSSALLTGCGFNNARVSSCCPTVAPVCSSCVTPTVYTTTSTCTSNFCGRGWY